MKRILTGVGIALGIGGGFFLLTDAPQEPEPVRKTNISLVNEGKVVFNANCAICHGVKGVGTDNGPPLVHKIYEPGHHADLSFQRAVTLGVRQHHWPFGNMPPVEGVSEKDIEAIIAYVRRVQRQAGIK